MILNFLLFPDTHYLSSTLLDSNIDYDEEGKQITKDGRTVQYINTLIDKLFDKVISEKPDYFIITGDLTFNGEKVSHLELADKMKILLDNGIQPLVIPGNHRYVHVKVSKRLYSRI